MITPPTFPARPISGGQFHLAPPKLGDWAYELKYGWRTSVHGPTGTMFNRKNKLLSISNEFAAVLPRLADASRQTGIEWWDCEALERRHDFARGSLIVLDVIVPDLSYTERHLTLQRQFDPIACLLLGPNQVSYSGNGSEGEELWEEAQAINAVRPEFVEGIVAKRLDSAYPFQLRRAEADYPFWVKHRHKF